MKNQETFTKVTKTLVGINVLDPDPRSCVFLPLDPEFGMGKISEYGMNIPDHFSESLETAYVELKILKR
jgi:hypothetical protein